MNQYPKIPKGCQPKDVNACVAPTVLYTVDKSTNLEQDHEKLNGLDLPNQHPIETIIGLREELDSLKKQEVIVEETDPTVPDWAKQETKPQYTAEEVGALAADTKIPTHLSDLEQDDNHLTVTAREKKKWNSGTGSGGGFSGDYEDLLNKPTIPSKLSELEEDSQHRLVTDEQINEWNKEVIIPEGFSGDYNDLTNKPQIPTQLSDLIDDENHRLVTDAEKELWTKGGENVFSGSYNDLTDKPQIPSQLKELNQDDEHQTVTAAEKEYWNSLDNTGFSGDYNDLINQPIIPTTLAELEQNDEYQTVAAVDKENWNNKLSTQQSVEDAGKIFTIDIDGKTKFNSLSELFSGITWGMLAGKS